MSLFPWLQQWLEKAHTSCIIYTYIQYIFQCVERMHHHLCRFNRFGFSGAGNSWFYIVPSTSPECKREFKHICITYGNTTQSLKLGTNMRYSCDVQTVQNVHCVLDFCHICSATSWFFLLRGLFVQHQLFLSCVSFLAQQPCNDTTTIPISRYHSLSMYKPWCDRCQNKWNMSESFITWQQFPRTQSHLHLWRRYIPWIHSCTPAEEETLPLVWDCHYDTITYYLWSSNEMEVRVFRTLARISPSWVLTFLCASHLFPRSKMHTSSAAPTWEEYG